MPIVYLLLLLLAVQAPSGWAQVPAARPGGVLRMTLDAAQDARPEVRFRGARALVRRGPDGWQALVGIPLDAAPGWHTLESAKAGGEARSIPFEVTPHDYPLQHLRVSNPRHVEPGPEELARYERERAEQDTAKAAWRELETVPVVLALPVRGRRSSAFGLRRTFNGEPRQPHRGLDLAVPTGTPVSAPAAGIITLTGDYFFNGKTVFVDHGQGLISMLCHLSEIEVQTGQAVRPGATLGRSGASGRATGPHVHWSVFLNGTAVDPDALLANGR